MKALLPTPIDELEAYLSGELEGWMGIRSVHGSMAEWGPSGAPTSTYTTPDGPSDGALVAARITRVVEQAVRSLPRQHALVLRARFTPVGPDAPFGLREALGPMAPVAVLFQPADRLRELARIAEQSDSPQARKDAKRLLLDVSALARSALSDATTAFLAAHRRALDDLGHPLQQRRRR